VISGFHCQVNENRAVLGHYAVSSGNSLLMFRDKSWPLKMGLIGCLMGLLKGQDSGSSKMGTIVCP